MCRESSSSTSGLQVPSVGHAAMLSQTQAGVDGTTERLLSVVPSKAVDDRAFRNPPR